MAYSMGDLRFIHSGGATNEDPNASLGGIISSAAGAFVLSQGVVQPTNITGVVIHDAFSNDYGDGTLSFYDATDSYTWTPPGGTESLQSISNGAGYYTVGDENSGQVYIYHDGTFPTGDQTDTIAISTLPNKTFDNVSFSEADAGDTEYRCFYVKNTSSGSIPSVSLWIGAQPSGADSMELGLDPAGIGNGVTTGVATTIADEDTAPAGVSFSTPSSSVPFSLGDLSTGGVQALWIKRVVPASTATMELFDTSSIIVQAFA